MLRPQSAAGYVRISRDSFGTEKGVTRQMEDIKALGARLGWTIVRFRRPVQGVTGNIDLMTANGRAMARMLTAMANKSSEGTSRRVARARLQGAHEGRTHKGRRFGSTVDGELIPEEAEILRWAAQRLIDGESWTGTMKILAAGQIQPPGDAGETCRPLDAATALLAR